MGAAPSNNSNEMLVWAIRYARMGWPVIPLRGKIPLTQHGSADASTNESQIWEWWKKTPNANIGVATGHTFFALDVDIKNGGEESFNSLLYKHGRIPDTIQQITGTGGQHYLFKLPKFEVRNSQSVVAEGIDIRGAGGYIVVAPSIHPDTKRAYIWDGLREIEDQAMAAAPDWLLAALQNHTAQRGQAPEPLPIDQKFPKGTQHAKLVSIAGTMRRRGLNAEEMLPTLRMVNQSRCTEPGPEENIRRIAESVARYPPDTKASIFRNLAKATDPNVDPVTRPAEPDPESSFMGSAAPPDPASGAEESSFLPKSGAAGALLPNDLARQILADHQFLQTTAGALYEFNSIYWERVPRSKLLGYAMQYDTHRHTKSSRRHEVVSYIEDAILRPEIAWRSLGLSEVACHNGVVDVKTGVMRAHKAADYLEAVIPHNYEPQERCPEWLKALDRWFRDDKHLEDKILALQEFAGYCLLPHARYKKALFLHGESDTGKSQVALVLDELVGTKNRCALSTEQMADERKRAPIVGKMLNSLTELPSDALIQDGGFKQLVSTGDPISIDPKYLTPFEYVPFCKHVICTNALPTISDLSRATFNRLLLIRFNNVIPVEEQDKNLLDRFSKEMPGLLNWAIVGAARLVEQNGEFTPIGESVEAVNEYRLEQNPINLFVEETCWKDEDSSIPMPDFRERFTKWVRCVYSPRKIANMIRAAGFRIDYSHDDRRKTVRSVSGLKWNPAATWTGPAY